MESQFQLVIQFNSNSPSDFERFVALEKTLIDELANLAEVDGHDCGSGEFNFFLYAHDPHTAFERVRQFMRSQGLDREMRAAFRNREEEEFVLLWPPGQTTFTIA